MATVYDSDGDAVEVDVWIQPEEVIKELVMETVEVQGAEWVLQRIHDYRKVREVGY